MLIPEKVKVAIARLEKTIDEFVKEVDELIDAIDRYTLEV